MKNKIKLQIGIIGSAGAEEYRKDWNPPKGLDKAAKTIGRLLGKKGISVVTGGALGIMEKVSKEVTKNKGIAIGLHNNFKDRVFGEIYNVCINCGMLEGGPEYILTLSSDIIIAISGGAGTLNEIAMAYRNHVPVVLLEGYGGWVDKIIPQLYEGKYLDKRKRVEFYVAKTPEQAVSIAVKQGTKRLNKLVNNGREFYKKENKKLSGKNRLL